MEKRPRQEDERIERIKFLINLIIYYFLLKINFIILKCVVFIVYKGFVCKLTKIFQK